MGIGQTRNTIHDDAQRGRVRIPLVALRALALGTLLLPTIVFLLTWVRPLVSVPTCAALAAAFVLDVRVQQRTSRDIFTCSVWVLLAAVCCALMWTLLSGIGGMFYQNEDHYGRNAIFHDLLNNTWPVYFEGSDFALTYYINYWILPALAGKGAEALLGGEYCWGVANAALTVQTVWFLSVMFLLLFALLHIDQLGKALLALFVFVMFSGMDALMAGFQNDWQNQIEWWARTYQYSSNTTCLFWVYNQAVPAWLGVMLLLSRKEDISAFALIGLSMLTFSPMPFVGLFVLAMGLAAAWGVHHVREKGVCAGLAYFVRSCLSARNVLAVAAILPVFMFYFSANAASGQAPFRLELYLYAYSPLSVVMRLLLFALVEFAAYALVMGRRYGREPAFVTACVCLLLAPLFKMGFNMDFSMRASIPGLTVLCVYAIDFLLEACTVRRHRYASAVLALLMLVGTVTPLLEFERGAYKVMLAGTNRMYSDPFGSVLHPDADTLNFICEDVHDSFFYTRLARKRAAP